MKASSLILLSKVLAAWALPHADMAVSISKHHKHYPDPGSPEYWCKMIISAALVLAGGVFAGYGSCDLIGRY